MPAPYLQNPLSDCHETSQWEDVQNLWLGYADSRAISHFKVKWFILHESIRGRSISPEPFERFSLNFTQMFLTLCRVHDPATYAQSRRSRSWDLPLNFVSAPYMYLLSPLGDFHFTSPKCSSYDVQSLWLGYRDSRSHFKVMWFTLQCMSSISPEPIERFSLNFTQMFLSVRRCAEHMTQLHRLKVTGQGISCLLHIERFSSNLAQLFLSVRRCAEPMTTQGQGHNPHAPYP